MMFYTLTVILIVLSFSLMYFIYQNVNLKVQLRFLGESSASSQLELEKLEDSKIEYIQKIEQLMREHNQK